MTISSLQSKLDSYLQLRESMGGTSGRMKSELQSFIDYLNLHGVFEPIRTHHAVDWACSNPARGASRQFQLLSLARGFMTHLKASVPETDIPPTNLIAKSHRRNPYIFSTGEINLLLQEAYRLQPLRSLRRHTHETLFGLLACTGIRVSEAINLSVSDVHLNVKPARLLVSNTKFGKSRWVPLHPTATEKLRQYAKLRRELRYEGYSDAFFVNERGEPVNYATLKDTFHSIIRRVGISAQPGRARPCLHSFRHAFAVQRLKQWYSAGQDVELLLPNLSVFLGHVDLTASYWYLSATPELLALAGNRFENYAGRCPDEEE